MLTKGVMGPGRCGYRRTDKRTRRRCGIDEGKVSSLSSASSTTVVCDELNGQGERRKNHSQKNGGGDTISQRAIYGREKLRWISRSLDSLHLTADWLIVLIRKAQSRNHSRSHLVKISIVRGSDHFLKWSKFVTPDKIFMMKFESKCMNCIESRYRGIVTIQLFQSSKKICQVFFSVKNYGLDYFLVRSVNRLHDNSKYYKP